MSAQTDHVQPKVHPEDREVDMDDPTFVPMVKVGKALEGGDSIQYVELNPVYCYPQPVFKNAKQRQAYNRLVYNVKKVLPIAKEVNMLIVETYDYLQTLPNKKAKDEHMKFVEKEIKREYTPRMKKLTYQQGKLLIKRHSEAYGRRRQQETDRICSRSISPVTHPAQAKEENDQDNRYQQRVHERQTRFPAQPYSKRI